ncbi:chromosome segregation protein SMC [Rothia aerolata]|uniref:Chromosome partition protein Smc n=1 Tax=Rothia aerolata TaxID=1812262 RepID=A0A917IMC9_9MICC|nr:chromosome segregation protein SMC [Rothia aerolata]GGH58754.1 chromosome partition protein Smc [Rothia aerolata]
MHLKSLTLRGFKSFASTTVFEFDPAINAVVGPNGSGKSNVVDALNWVLGEQGPKSLRGGSMKDVIFAGTSSRSSLGRAKVTLVIDNSDSALDFPATEVEVSRTMFRSGGSEYEINGSAVRLADVQDLLSDAGVGKSQHAVVGQGHIERILHASSLERRGFIEEAAGVLKYRRRAEKAERKLANLKANLDRLEDLEAELLSQLEPLGEQAETAREAREVQAQARALRSDLLAASAAELVRQQKEQDDAAAAVRQQQRRAQAEVESSENKQVSLNRESEKLRKQIESLRQRIVTLDQLLARARAVAAVAAERLRSQPDSTLAGHRERITRAKTEESSLAQQVETWQKKQTELARELEQHKAKTEELSHLLVQGEAELENLENQRQNHRTSVAELTSALAVARARAEKAEALKSEREDELEEARRVLKNLQSVLEEAGNAELERTSELKGLEKSVEEARTERSNLAENLEKARQRVTELQLSHEGLKAQHATLRQALDTSGSEGKETVPSHLQRVYEALTVEKGWEKAVARALGELAEAWLVEEETDQEFSRVFLRRKGKGSSAQTGETSVSLPAKYTPATSLISGEATVLTSLEPILAGVALCENLPPRSKYEKQLAKYPGLVLIAANGAMHTPQATLLGQGIQRSTLETAAQIAAVEEERATVQGELTAAQEAVKGAEEEFEQSRQREKTLARSVGSARAALASASAELMSLKSRGESATADLKRLSKKAETAAALEAEAQQELEKAVKELDRAVATQPAAGLTELKEKNQELRAELNSLKTELATLEVREENARQQAASCQQQLLASRQELDRLTGELAQQEELENLHRVQRAQAGSLRGRAEELETVLKKEAEAAREDLSSIQRSRKELAEQEEAAQDVRKHLRAELDQLTRQLGDVGIERAKLEAQRDNLERRAEEELSADLEDLLENFAQRQESFDRSEAERKLAEAQKQLEQLGTVNPLALEEYSALEQRHSYLKEQIDDLKKSRSDMRSLMRQLNQHIRDEFTRAFEETREQFERIFAEIFPGGEGTLVLTDPDDTLESGIDIQARPAGKKVKRLSLLSGGERALVSLALLTAIFAARPGPFYVLDEVEAALDDRNLSRILEVFKELAVHSQLIIVTHKPRTVEIAEAIYGISVVDGVSQVMSQSASALKKEIEG